MRSGSKCIIRRKQAIWLYLFGRELFQFFYSSFAWIQIPEFVIVQLLSRVRLWDLMDRSMPVFPDLHYLLEFAQMHVHYVGDAIQPSHPLLPPSLPALNLSQPQGLFQWICFLHQVNKVLELQLQHQFFQWIFRVDYLKDWFVGSSFSPKTLKIYE